jgi:hypothetical protein
VTRVVKDDKSQPVGMGLVFIEISESGKKELLKSLYLVYQAGNNKSSR